eukprot:8217453-Karenia_brevis.AAC.1
MVDDTKNVWDNVDVGNLNVNSKLKLGEHERIESASIVKKCENAMSAKNLKAKLNLQRGNGNTLDGS